MSEIGSRPVFLLSVGNKENNIVNIHQTAHKLLYDESFTEKLYNITFTKVSGYRLRLLLSS